MTNILQDKDVLKTVSEPVSELVSEPVPDILSKTISTSVPSVVPTVYSNFIMVDSGDGGGKGALIEVFKESLLEKNIPFFDCVEYWKMHDRLPHLEEVQELVPGCKAIFVAEPTYVGIGKLLREELINKDANERYIKHGFGAYDARATAVAYAIDRDVLYKRLLIDALHAGMFIVADRGIITSDVYQPLQASFAGIDEWEFRAFVHDLPGNKQAFAYLPSVFILPRVPTAERMRRLAHRSTHEDKDDRAIFETSEFQAAITKSYDDPKMRAFYEDKGSSFFDFEVDVGEDRSATKKRFRKEFSDGFLAELFKHDPV